MLANSCMLTYIFIQPLPNSLPQESQAQKERETLGEGATSAGPDEGPRLAKWIIKRLGDSSTVQ